MNPRKFFIGRAIGFVALFIVVGGFFLFNQYMYNEKQEGPTAREPSFCTADVKLCPDGSYVGRVGEKNCAFADCPSIDNDVTEVTTALEKSATALNVTISPQEIISDSRCATGVQCVWAGTVEVRTTLATEVSHGEQVLTLGKPQVFGEYTVTLVEVSPEKTEEEMLEADYRFTFEVKKI